MWEITEIRRLFAQNRQLGGLHLSFFFKFAKKSPATLRSELLAIIRPTTFPVVNITNRNQVEVIDRFSRKFEKDEKDRVHLAVIVAVIAVVIGVVEIDSVVNRAKRKRTSHRSSLTERWTSI